MGMGGLVQRNDHDARGIKVQSMNNTRRGVVLLQSGNKTVFVERVPAGNAQQEIGLAHQQ